MKIERITVYGFGLIGAGWTTFLLIKGIEKIKAFDIDPNGLERGKQILNDNMDFMVHEGIIDEDNKQRLIDKVVFTTDRSIALNDADLVIENGPENINIKRAIIADIERFCAPETIITSSTSGLLLKEIVAKADYPERVLGVHPYHPVYLLPLLEMQKTDCTDETVIEEVKSFFRSIDKKPVMLNKPSDGYIGSRLMTALLRESVSMILDGVCGIEDIDDAFTYGPGMRYGLFGIFTTLQLGGGEQGFHGMMCGPMGKSSDKWLKSYCNWDHWPQPALDFFESSQEEIDKMLADRDEVHGRDNKGLEEFRDKGLLGLLKIHEMI